MDYKELNNLMTNYDNKSKFIKSATRAGFSEESFCKAERKQESQSNE
jgi:hypothetical protein